MMYLQKEVAMKAMSISKSVLIIIGFAVLALYSGQWEVFTSKNDVRDLALSGNTLWAATTGGVVVWDLGDNSYKSYTTLDGLLSCNVTQVAIDKKGRTWVATKDPNGLFIYENNKWKQNNLGGVDNELAEKFISGLEVDRFGNVWAYTRSSKWDYYSGKYSTYLWRYDGQTWHKHEGVYGPLALDPQNNLLAIDSIFSEKKNPVHTIELRIVLFNGAEFVDKWRSKVHKHFYEFALAHIAQDSEGNPWISYYDERFGTTYGVVCNDTLYNTLDGLADDNVRSITTDESGSVWCATDGGISKFTGVGWVTYDTTDGVASNLTYKILIGNNNALYVATSKGISILKSNQWKTLKTINEPSHNNHTDMVIDKRDAVIFSGSDHIAIYNDLKWKMINFRNIRFGNSIYRHFPYHNANNSFIKSKDGTVYAIGNEIGKVWILKQRTGGSIFFKAFSYTIEKDNRFLSPFVACSGIDSCFWLTDVHGNLILMNKQRTATFYPYQFGVEGGSDISCMLLDRDGRSVWVGYNNLGTTGIVHFNGDSVKKPIKEDDGLESDKMTAIACDSSENLWFASRRSKYRRGGVTVLRNTKLTTYVKDHNGKVFGGCNALFVDKTGMVWAHSDSGIARFDGNSWNLFNSAAVSPDLPYARYSHIIQDESGTVWFGTEGSGLIAYKNNKWYQFTTCDGIPHNSIRSCALDSKDNLWILTDNGIAMRKSDKTFNNQSKYDFVNSGKKLVIKQHGNRFYVSSKDTPKMTRCTLFDLRGRVVLRQAIHHRKSFVLPENDFNIGPGVRILSIITENTDGFQSKYLLKIGGIK